VRTIELKQNFLDKIQKILDKEQYFIDEKMASHVTFAVGGPADIYLLPGLEQIADVVKTCTEFEIPVTIIGNGSNLLVGDKGIRGAVIAFGNNMETVTTEGHCLYAGAGAKLCDAANEAAKYGLTGLEFASGIPGSIGGAIVMNAGAYGGEMKDVVKSVSILTKDGEKRELSLEEMEFSYRHSCIIKNQYFVLGATLQLQEGCKEEIKAQIKELTNKRESKQPLEYPSAGSTFKRPEGYFAGKLIMDSGLRGFSVGGAQVSEKHCGFVINKNHATAKDICDLIDEVIRIVYEKQHVKLEPEVKRIGEF